MKFALAFLLFATFSTAFKFHRKSFSETRDNANPPAGYIFMGEQSICSCRENVVYFNFVKYIADNIIPFGNCNGYGIRAFGDKAFNDSNLLTGYFSKDGMERKIDYWITDDMNSCRYSDNVTYQSPLQNMLRLVKGAGDQAYQRNAIFLQGETDTIVDLDVSLALARQIASYNQIIYIWDHSKFGDQTGLFSILTNNKPGHIIYANASLIELINIAKGQLFGDFAGIGCGVYPPSPPPTPEEPQLPGEPGYCPNIVPIYHATTTTTPSTTTTTPPPTTTSTTTTTPPPTTTTIRTTTTPPPPTTTSTTTTRPPSTTTSTRPPTNNNICYRIMFVGEMTVSITSEQKRTFYDSILQISASLPTSRLQFSLMTYGTNILQNTSFLNYQDFVNTINNFIAGLPNPNSSMTVVQKPYGAIYKAITDNPTQKLAAFVMGQMEAVQDPYAGKTQALKVAGTNTNVYVLDYSHGTLPVSLFPYLTGDHLERIVNGTGKSASDIKSAFQGTLISDVINNHC